MQKEGNATMAMADLISRAQAGDGYAFRELTEPHHREIQVHCYRMLGSFQDAEDALQDTLLSAWRGLGGFDGRVEHIGDLVRVEAEDVTQDKHG